nr:unnamed protein product [Naegleria fowleri]
MATTSTIHMMNHSLSHHQTQHLNSSPNKLIHLTDESSSSSLNHNKNNNNTNLDHHSSTSSLAHLLHSSPPPPHENSNQCSKDNCESHHKASIRSNSINSSNLHQQQDMITNSNHNNKNNVSSSQQQQQQPQNHQHPNENSTTTSAPTGLLPSKSTSRWTKLKQAFKREHQGSAAGAHNDKKSTTLTTSSTTTTTTTNSVNPSSSQSHTLLNSSNKQQQHNGWTGMSADPSSQSDPSFNITSSQQQNLSIHQKNVHLSSSSSNGVGSLKPTTHADHSSDDSQQQNIISDDPTMMSFETFLSVNTLSASPKSTGQSSYHTSPSSPIMNHSYQTRMTSPTTAHLKVSNAYLFNEDDRNCVTSPSGLSVSSMNSEPPPVASFVIQSQSSPSLTNNLTKK